MSKPLWETNFTSTYHQQSYPSISPTRPEVSAAGKTVLISGGGRGLGIGIVEAFAAAGAAHIIILGRNATTLNEVAERLRPAHPSTKISTVSGDVSVESDVARAFAPAADTGGVDVVVANAGYLPAVRPIAGAGAAGDGDSGFTEDWWKSWEVNVKGLFLLARQFLASARGPGAVFVNISAAAAHINPSLPHFSAYSGSKLGAARVVEALQLEYPDFRFHNVHPGVVASDMLTKSGLEALNVPQDERESLNLFINFASPCYLLANH
jgi:NAD(P)-dependent dehydrogenase (short-subunit alcohol dehydrogenase family)